VKCGGEFCWGGLGLYKLPREESRATLYGLESLPVLPEPAGEKQSDEQGVEKRDDRTP